MTSIQVIVDASFSKGFALKAIRSTLPSTSLSDLIQRVESGRPVFESQLFTNNHDAVVTQVRRLVDCLGKANVPFRIVKLLDDVKLVAGGPKQSIRSELSVAALDQLFVDFEDIRKEQQDLSELENDTE